MVINWRYDFGKRKQSKDGEKKTCLRKIIEKQEIATRQREKKKKQKTKKKPTHTLRHSVARKKKTRTA